MGEPAVERGAQPRVQTQSTAPGLAAGLTWFNILRPDRARCEDQALSGTAGISLKYGNPVECSRCERFPAAGTETVNLRVFCGPPSPGSSVLTEMCANPHMKLPVTCPSDAP